MANVNCATVLNLIREAVSVSRKEITERSGLSWGGMTKIVNRLLEKEYIIEEKSEKSASGGRIPGLLRINTAKNHIIGLDINKTGLKATVMNLSGTIIKNYNAVAEAETKESFLSAILRFTESVFADFPESIIAVGVAMQGIVNYKRGISVRFPDIADWENVPIKDILEEAFGVQVFVEHDPDCLLYPHLSSEKKENIVLLRIDKSIGMAAAIGGKIIKGEGIFEIAHITAVPDGKLCQCGQRGCPEAYLGACMKNPTAENFRDLIVPLGSIVHNMACMFHAGRVIITGELTKYSALFAENLQAFLQNTSFSAALTFCDSADLAAPGAAQIAAALFVKQLTI